MIKAKDLRIGNWVVLRKRMEQVESWMFIQETKNMEPIPITHEILIACRFEKDEIGGHDYFTNPQCPALNGSIINSGMNFMHLPAAPCQSLHQLQNLYFALTGIELEYKA